MHDLLYSFFNVFCLFVWFNTEAFIEYCKYIPFLKKSLKIQDYYEYQRKGGNLKYPIYLQVNYNNFFNRMISCIYCLLFWINMGTLLFINDYIIFFVNYVFSLVIYYIMLIIIKKYESFDF
jgi:hypothetical protein